MAFVTNTATNCRKNMNVARQVITVLAVRAAQTSPAGAIPRRPPTSRAVCSFPRLSSLHSPFPCPTPSASALRFPLGLDHWLPPRAWGWTDAWTPAAALSCQGLSPTSPADRMFLGREKSKENASLEEMSQGNDPKSPEPLLPENPRLDAQSNTPPDSHGLSCFPGSSRCQGSHR